MVDALHRFGDAGLHPSPGTPRHELLAAFDDAVFQPIVRHLEAVKSNAKSLRALEHHASTLDVGHLGAIHTQNWLVHAGLVDSDPEGPWIANARRHVQLQTPGAGQPPHQRDILAWIAFDVLVRSAGLEERVREPGKIATFDATATSSRELMPLFVGHSRAGHAERTALLCVLDSVRAAERRLLRRALRPDACEPTGAPTHVVEISGDVQLFAAHTPCLSCLAVFAQFSRLLPNVSMSVAFQDARLQAAGPR